MVVLSPLWLKGLTALLALVGMWRIRAAWQHRQQVRARLRREAETDYGRALELARQKHDSEEAQREAEWAQSEQWRERVRAAADHGDVEALSMVLEEELSNEDLPVPLVFEVEFEGTESVRIELALPDLDDVPEQHPVLTSTGKVSFRRMAKADRSALYEDLCCGLVLRLAWETFRVLPMVERVEVFGTSEGVDPATGHLTEFVALHLMTRRAELQVLDLDAVDPSAALRGLGGMSARTGTGEPKPILGLIGLLQDTGPGAA